MTVDKHSARLGYGELFRKQLVSKGLLEHFDTALHEVVWLRDRNSPQMAIAKVRRWAASRARVRPIEFVAARPRIDMFRHVEKLHEQVGPPRTQAIMYIPFVGAAELWQWRPDDVEFRPVFGDAPILGEKGEVAISATLPIGRESEFRAVFDEQIRRLRIVLRYQKEQVERYNAGVSKLVAEAFPIVGDRKRVLADLASIRIERDSDEK